MALRSQDVHTVTKGLLLEECLFVLLVADVLLHNAFIQTLGLFYVAAGGQGCYTFWGTDRRSIGRPAHSSYIFPNTFLLAVQCRG